MGAPISLHIQVPIQVITRACSPQARDILGLATYHLRDDLLP